MVPEVILYQQLILFNHLSNEFEVIISSDIRGLKYIDSDYPRIKIINTPKLNKIYLLPFKFFYSLLF